MPVVVWSDKLASAAQHWAERLLNGRKFYHQPDNPYGENLFEIAGGTASSAEVVGSWASEARAYDYRSNSCTSTCGHYTQIVWRYTKQIGCGVAQGGGRQIWVCEYSPPGNVIGERPY